MEPSSITLIICVRKEIYDHITAIGIEHPATTFSVLDEGDVNANMRMMLDYHKNTFGKVVLLTDMTRDSLTATKNHVLAIRACNAQLLLEGNVEVASPPLYNILKSDNTLFIRDANSFLKVKAAAFEECVVLSMIINGNTITLADDNFASVYRVIEVIGRCLFDIAEEFDTAPEMVELLAHCITELKTHDADAIKKKLALTNCFYERENSTLVFDVNGMEDHLHTNGFVEALEAKLMPMLRSIRWDEMELVLDVIEDKENDGYSTTFIEIYTHMQVLNKELNITKIKSITELDGKDISVSCLDDQSKAFTTVTCMRDVSQLFKLLNYESHTEKIFSLLGLSNVIS